MLVLTRLPGESIDLITRNGEEIRLSILKFQAGGVRVGVEAAESIDIWRSEIPVAERSRFPKSEPEKEPA